MNTPIVSVPSAVEIAKLIDRLRDPCPATIGIDKEDMARAADMLGALLTACEALEAFAKMDLSSLFSDGENEPYICVVVGAADAHDFTRQDVLRARAALSCPAPPSEKQGGDNVTRVTKSPGR